MHENPKPLEMDDDIDDMDGMGDGEGGNDGRDDFMQEDQEDKSMNKGVDHTLTSKLKEQQDSHKGKAKQN
jgi:hypothetical protein